MPSNARSGAPGWLRHRAGRDILVAIASCFAAFAARPADACSPLPPVGGRAIVPRDGASGVPLNARIVVMYPLSNPQLAATPTDGPAPKLTDVLVRPRGGAPIEATVELTGARAFDAVVVVRPSANLQPRTAYEVLDRVKAPCYASGSCVEAFSVRATFETGDAADTTPPTFAGVTGIASGSLDVCDSSACCGPYRAVPVTLTLDTAQDAGGPLFYEISENGAPVLRFFGGGTLIGAVSCNGRASPFASFVTHTGATLSVHAVDLAGNIDANTATVTVTAACPTSTTDAGVDAATDQRNDAAAAGGSAGHADDAAAANAGATGSTPDAGSRDKQPTGRQSDESSCAFGRGPTPDSFVSLAIMTIAVVLARRRRSA
jgi:hypothetical protein